MTVQAGETPALFEATCFRGCLQAKNKKNHPFGPQDPPASRISCTGSSQGPSPTPAAKAVRTASTSGVLWHMRPRNTRCMLQAELMASTMAAGNDVRGVVESLSVTEQVSQKRQRGGFRHREGTKEDSMWQSHLGVEKLCRKRHKKDEAKTTDGSCRFGL